MRAPALLGPCDAEPLTLLRPKAPSRVLLVCEHAGRATPAALGDLGVPAAEMDRHIAWDVGAMGLAEALSARLDAAVIAQPYSRLVIDCNRPTAASDLVPGVSDGVPIPGNAGLDEAARALRLESIHAPFHAAIAAQLDQRTRVGLAPVLVTIHSFTPRLAVGGLERPWQAGFCCNRDDRLARALLAETKARAPSLCLALNEPYSVDDLGDYTIPVHGEARGLLHVLIEVRNGEITEPAGQRCWADLRAEALAAAIVQLNAREAAA
jgi:predicted N-formylglutamate amidohydrolase